MKNSFLIVLFTVIAFTSKAVSVNVKTIGTSFDPDTVYINLGDTIHFIISIGHDAAEITEAGYAANSMDYFPSGFNYPFGTYDFVPDSVKTYHYACSFHLLSDQMKGVLIVSWPLANNEIDLSENPLIYPNPFDHEITVSGLTAISSVKISDISGRIVYNEFVFGKIYTSSLPSGIYCIEIIYNEKKYVSKLIRR